MRCPKSRELISTAFDAELSEHDRCELVEHLATCEDCRTHHAVLEKGQTLLAEGLVDPPENFEWKVQLGIQRALRERATEVESTTFGWGFWGRTAATATTMAALVLLVGSFLMRGSEVHAPGMASGEGGPAALVASLPEEGSAAAPDLSGARPVTDFEVDAFRSGYGIRTVADQQSIGSVGEHYPIAGRRVFRSSLHPYLTPATSNLPSQVLHLRIVPTKLRSAEASSSSIAASVRDSAETILDRRR